MPEPERLNARILKLRYTDNLDLSLRFTQLRFVVKDEQPFSVVDGEGFKELLQSMQPKFDVPGRMTINRDIFKLFCEERVKLKKDLTKGGQRGKTIGKVIETCLLGWGLEKVLSVNVDNASANDVVVGCVKKRINAWKGSVLDGDWLKELHDSIAAILNSVRYIRSSFSRLQKFNACVEREKITYKGGLVLDVPTRWNSTFMMLDVAFKFEKAFASYEDEDHKYKMKYLKFLFECLYDSQTVAKITMKVEEILNELFEVYNVEFGGGESNVAKNDSLKSNETHKRSLLENYMQKQQLQVSEKMNDLQRYLVEKSLDPTTTGFDILLWWKANASRYVILSMIAKDVLAILVSTVASKSTFSTSGHILDSFRSSLSPKMLEA
ncbi:zinc finger BED domain-containing protein RICESLEEPER 2-like [Cynara cardunculus var. scolymus]|uniref:zinc finger BED domain-containing protein RICESLEEPER 2-like n=1 Tax=Cynara cardunculus var. scolymus TaxID=59895 RepID=UPI000D62BED4|nr:zinc finger BED domain-containing protein RICESLEEPER 2-like [Cynara cardunculus var. scolymus]